jgi:hypothetical protein
MFPHPSAKGVADPFDIGKAVTSRYHEPAQRIVFFGHQMASVRMARKILKRLKVETIGVNPKHVVDLQRFTDDAAGTLARVDAPVVGVVVNKVDARQQGYNNYYYSY